MSSVIIKRPKDLTEIERNMSKGADLESIKRGGVNWVAVGGEYGGIVYVHCADLGSFMDKLRYFGLKYEVKE